MLPDVPSPEFQVFDCLEKMHIYLSSASFWSSSSVSIQLTLILFPRNCRPVVKRQLIHLAPQIMLNNLPCNISISSIISSITSVIQEIDKDFFPPILGNTTGWSKLTKMMKGEVISGFTLPDVIVSYRKLILISSHDAILIQTHMRFSLGRLFPSFHVSSG